MASQNEEMFSIVSVVRGHHVCKSVWTPLLGERLPVRPETGNNHYKYAVSVVKHGGIVGPGAFANRVALYFAWKPGDL